MEFPTELLDLIQSDGADGLSAALDNNPSLITAVDSKGFTLLHYAALNESNSCSRLLLGRGVDIEARNAWGNTPLWVAVMSYRGDSEVVSALLQRGANPDAQNNQGRTPRHMAALIANYDVKKFFES